MKMVRLDENIVVEIIPEAATPVINWYGEAFAAQCVEAPEDIKQGMVYDPTTQTFSEASVVEPTPTIEEQVATLTIENNALKEQLVAQDSAITAILEEIIPSLFPVTE